jgi:hypothetical protein
MVDENDKELGLSETGQATSVTPRGVDGKIQIAVSRLGLSVHMALGCGDEYTAIEIYERIVRSVKDGQLRLDLRTGNSG